MDQNTGVSVHTGFPNPATDTRIQSLDLNRLLIWNSVSTFMMKIDGGTWAERGVYDGDVVIIDRALSPKQTDIVAWVHDDQFALSRIKTVPQQAAVWGVVTAIIHRYRELQ